MDSPPDFDYYVGAGVQRFAELHEDDKAAQQWHEVTDGTLGDRRVLVRLARDEQGALMCTGLLVGLDGEDVTSANLRDIPVTAVVRDIGRRISEPRSDIDRILADVLGPLLPTVPRRDPSRPSRGGAGPTDEELADFMQALYVAGGLGRRGAVARAATAYGIDRSTAYRWLPLAERRGITGRTTGEER